MNTRRKLPAILKEWFAPLCQSHPGLPVATKTPLLTPLGSCWIAASDGFVVTVAGLEATNFHLNSTSTWTFLLTPFYYYYYYHVLSSSIFKIPVNPSKITKESDKNRYLNAKTSNPLEKPDDSDRRPEYWGGGGGGDIFKLVQPPSDQLHQSRTSHIII